MLCRNAVIAKNTGILTSKSPLIFSRMNNNLLNQGACFSTKNKKKKNKELIKKPQPQPQQIQAKPNNPPTPAEDSFRACVERVLLKSRRDFNNYSPH